jgi:hypothetical protein
MYKFLHSQGQEQHRLQVRSPSLGTSRHAAKVQSALAHLMFEHFSELAIRQGPQICFGIAATDGKSADLASIFDCSSRPAFARR